MRHYDRIGLVSPHKKDEWTRYRYYTEDEIVRLHTVHALRCMDLPLAQIKTVLELNDFPKIVKFLESAEKKADEKIAELQNAKARIRRAKAAYEGMGTAKPAPDSIFIRELPQRVILLSDKLTEPTVENLWNYLRHFLRRSAKRGAAILHSKTLRGSMKRRKKTAFSPSAPVMRLRKIC